MSRNCAYVVVMRLNVYIVCRMSTEFAPGRGLSSSSRNRAAVARLRATDAAASIFVIVIVVAALVPVVSDMGTAVVSVRVFI